MPTTMLVCLATAPFYVMLRVVNCPDGDTQPPKEHTTSVVYTKVLAKVYELAVIAKGPYVVMYNIWLAIMLAVKYWVQWIFYSGVYVLETIGNFICNLVVLWPCKLFELVMSEPRVSYDALMTMKAYAVTTNNWFNEKYTTSSLVSVCFDCIHTAFLMLVHAWVVYTLYAHWTTVASIVYSVHAYWMTVTGIVYSLKGNWTTVTGNWTTVTDTV